MKHFYVRSIFFTAFCLVSSILMAGPFSAVTEEQPVCYGREYSAKHLKEHPKQAVQKIRIKLEKLSYGGGDPSQYMNLELTLKGDNNYYRSYRASFNCGDDGRCGIDCDGGSATVSLKDSGDRLVLKNHGFDVQGGCGDDIEATLVALNNEKGADDIFWGYKLRNEYCQNNDLWE